MSSVAERRAAARRRKILAAGENRMSQVMNLVEGTRVKPADAADDAPAVAIDAPTVASSAPEAAAPAKVDWRERMKKRRAAAVAAAGPAASPDELLEATAREMLDDDDGEGGARDAEEQATASSSSSTTASAAAAAAVARVEAAAVSAPSPAETRRNVAALRRRRRQQQQQQDSTDATGGTKEGEPAEKPKAPPPRADGKPDPLARWRAAEAEKEAKKEAAAAAGPGPGGMLGSLASMAGIPGLAGGGDGAAGGDAAAAAAAVVAAGSRAGGGGGGGADAGGKAKPGSLRLIVEKQRLEAQQMHLRSAALVLCALCCAGFACTGAAAETWGVFAGLGGSGGGAAAAALQPYIDLLGQLGGDIVAVEQKMQAAKHGHLVDALYQLRESGGLDAAAGGGGGGGLAYISAFDDGPGLFSAPVGYARHLLGEMTLFPPFLLLVVGHRLLADASFRLLHGQPLLGGGSSNSAAPGAMGLMGTAMASYGYVKALVADFSLFLFIVIMSMALFSIATNGF
jgi:hypothetical protein